MRSILKPDNRLFTLARRAERQPSALTAIAVVVVMLLVVIVSQAIARFLVRSVFPSGIQAMGGQFVEGILGFLPIYLGLWIWLRLSSKRPFWSLGFERRGALRQILGGALIALLMMTATAGLAVIPGASLALGKWQNSPVSGLGLGLLSLLVYAVQGPAEETLFRGWLLPVIGARYRPWTGVLVSALLFSLAHATNILAAPLAPVAFLNLFLFGVFAAFYALAEGGLWGICAWHAIWNWAQGDVLGFAVSGGAPSGLLLSIRATGPDAITGGAFGPEGGIAATAVFLIAIGVVAMRARREEIRR